MVAHTAYKGKWKRHYKRHRKRMAKNWIWPERLPWGITGLLCTEPAVQRWFVADLIARFTTGKDWPDISPNGARPGGKVLYFNNSERTCNRMRERVDMLGGDLGNWVPTATVHEKVEYIEQARAKPGEDEEGICWQPSLADGVFRTAFNWACEGVSLVVLDPLLPVTKGWNLGYGNHVDELEDALLELGATVVFTGRPNASQLRRNGQWVPDGCSAFHAVPDMWLNLVPDKHDNRTHVYRSKLSEEEASPCPLSYTVEGERLAWQWAPKLEPNERYRAAVPRVEANATKQQRARAMLLEMLASGPARSTAIEQEAKDRGISYGTLRLARSALQKEGIITKEQKPGYHLWKLKPGQH